MDAPDAPDHPTAPSAKQQRLKHRADSQAFYHASKALRTGAKSIVSKYLGAQVVLVTQSPFSDVVNVYTGGPVGVNKGLAEELLGRIQAALSEARPRRGQQEAAAPAARTALAAPPGGLEFMRRALQGCRAQGILGSNTLQYIMDYATGEDEADAGGRAVQSL